MRLNQWKAFENPYRWLLAFNFFVVLAVMALFRWIENREIASVFAGSLFLLSPSLTLISEWRLHQSWKSFAAITSLIFLLLSALPIFLLRLMNWGVPFENLSLVGFSGPQLHQASNGMFFLMLGGLWWGSQQMKKARV